MDRDRQEDVELAEYGDNWIPLGDEQEHQQVIWGKSMGDPVDDDEQIMEDLYGAGIALQESNDKKDKIIAGLRREIYDMADESTVVLGILEGYCKRTACPRCGGPLELYLLMDTLPMCEKCRLAMQVETLQTRIRIYDMPYSLFFGIKTDRFLRQLKHLVRRPRWT